MLILLRWSISDTCRPMSQHLKWFHDLKPTAITGILKINVRPEIFYTKEFDFNSCVKFQGRIELFNV